jgi:acetolactate synthase-1/2/3 large subunit
VIICGGGVVIASACEALADLAGLLNAPVCTTVSGQGSLADSHPLNAGVVGTNGGVPATRAVVAQADLVLFVGCRAGSTTTEHWQMPPRQITIVHLDVDPMTIATNYRTDVALVGDARLACRPWPSGARARRAAPADAADGRALAARARAEAGLLRAAGGLAGAPDPPRARGRSAQPPAARAPSWWPTRARPARTSRPISMHPRPGATSSPTAHGALGFSMAAGVGASFGRPTPWWCR